MDAIDHGKVVLAAILGRGGVTALDYASARINVAHFDDRVQRGLFILAQRYADQTRGILPRHALEDLLRDRDPGTGLLYLEYFDALAALRPTVPDFRHSLGMLRELAAERETGEALAQGLEILRHGARDERGNPVRGHEDARAHVVAAFADIEREAAAGEAPEGDIRRETGKMHAVYAKASELRTAGRSAGIATGLPRLDQALSGGYAPGELALIMGFASAGKSQWCAHQAWHASVMQGRDVLLFATETTRANMQVRILGRHSRLPKFGLQRGLNTRDIRAGTLSPGDYSAFKAVLDDFGKGDYGKCYIVQVPRGATIGSLEARAAAVSRQFAPELVIIDYLALIRPDRARKDRREELSPVLMDAKQFAVTFRDGQGVPVLSPWQVSREGRKEARTRGGYSLSDLSETAEAANTPDIILSLMDPENDDTRGRKVPLTLEVLKNRENERFVKLELTADFASSYFTVREQGSDSLLDSLMEEEQ